MSQWWGSKMKNLGGKAANGATFWHRSPFAFQVKCMLPLCCPSGNITHLLTDQLARLFRKIQHKINVNTLPVHHYLCAFMLVFWQVLIKLHYARLFNNNRPIFIMSFTLWPNSLNNYNCTDVCLVHKPFQTNISRVWELYLPCHALSINVFIPLISVSCFSPSALLRGRQPS